MTRGARRLLFSSILIPLMLAGHADAGQTSCPDAVDTTSPVLANGFGGNLSNTRNNPSSIDSANVAGLSLAFGHAASGSIEKRGAPSVTAQAVFFSAGRAVIAMNRLSGCQYWSYTIPDRTTAFVGGNAVRSSAVYYLNEGAPAPALVLVGDAHATFYALDAVTGQLVWLRDLGTDPDHFWITGAPQFYNGKMFVPIATKQTITAVLELVRICCRTHGLLHTIDPYTGQTIWIYHATPGATFHPKEGVFAPNGVSLWGVPAVDPARGLVYVGTGQNLTPPATSNSDSIVALDIETGAARWVFQATADDAWNAACGMPPPLDRNCVPPGGPDFDFGAPPVLVTLDDGTDALIAGSKNGYVYSLDRDTGAVKWSRRIGAGGNLGGIHWGMAVDAQHVYAAVSDMMINKLSTLDIWSIVRAPGIRPVRHASPGIYALDLKTGGVAWAVHPRHECMGWQIKSVYSAAVSVTNDVVLAGSLDGIVKAFRSSDGQEIWTYDTKAPFVDPTGETGHGGSIDSVGPIVAGTDVLVNSGYASFGRSNEFQAGPGNALLIFRLPPASSAAR